MAQEHERHQSKNEVLEALKSASNNVEDNHKATLILSKYLESIDTRNLSKSKRIRIQGILNGLKKSDSEISDPQRYIDFIDSI